MILMCVDCQLPLVVDVERFPSFWCPSCGRKYNAGDYVGTWDIRPAR